jgi:hypothetical protein
MIMRCRPRLDKDRGESLTPSASNFNSDKTRARGYQFKSEGPGEKRRYKPAYSTLDGISDALAESQLPDEDAREAELQEHGLGNAALAK